LTFPNNAFATVTAAYARPYDDPLSVAAEERVEAQDGRRGWVPDAVLALESC
jgi:hypothetical protein